MPLKIAMLPDLFSAVNRDLIIALAAATLCRRTITNALMRNQVAMVTITPKGFAGRMVHRSHPQSRQRSSNRRHGCL
jgi:hypothetical protein